jgi:uncharacterized protein (DUF58 family)
MGAAPGELLLDPLEPLDGRQLELAVRRLADSLRYGNDRSPFVGAGLEYAQSRPYQPGDPARAIDWRVTARTRRYHVKEYESPKQTPVHLVVDTSASMVVGSGPRTKYAVAVQVAAALALVALERVSPVGLTGAGDRALRVEPSLSRDQVYRWMHLLRRHRADEGTTLGRRLLELAAGLPERTLIIALSDLHDPQAAPALAQLAQAHEVVAIQLQDPAETGLPGAGLLRAREAETGRLVVGPAARPLADPAELAQGLRRRRVDHLLLRTDGPVALPLRRFLDARGLLRRGAR